jgi:hypothetical protein
VSRVAQPAFAYAAGRAMRFACALIVVVNQVTTVL